MCKVEATIFSECSHIYQYSLISRCHDFIWWQPCCEAWDANQITKLALKDCPYCRDCYQKRRREIIEISATVGAGIAKSGLKAGLSEGQMAEIREELQAQLHGALNRWDELCLKGSQIYSCLPRHQSYLGKKMKSS